MVANPPYANPWLLVKPPPPLLRDMNDLPPDDEGKGPLPKPPPWFFQPPAREPENEDELLPFPKPPPPGFSYMRIKRPPPSPRGPEGAHSARGQEPDTGASSTVPLPRGPEGAHSARGQELDTRASSTVRPVVVPPRAARPDEPPNEAEEQAFAMMAAETELQEIRSHLLEEEEEQVVSEAVEEQVFAATVDSEEPDWGEEEQMEDDVSEATEEQAEMGQMEEAIVYEAAEEQAFAAMAEEMEQTEKDQMADSVDYKQAPKLQKRDHVVVAAEAASHDDGAGQSSGGACSSHDYWRRSQGWWSDVADDGSDMCAVADTASSQAEARGDWLERHGLDTVDGVDAYGWTALHHVAFESKDDARAASMFGEMLQLSWTPEQLNLVTPTAPEFKPIGWTALHLLANERSPTVALCKKRAELAQLILDKRANPMTTNARGTTPLHTAAATSNLQVAEVLLKHPGVNVNAKNKDNKHPWDCCTNWTIRELVENHGGIASPNKTGTSSRDEPHRRGKPRPYSQSGTKRSERARKWRESHK